jgi:hypothetical protein
VSAVYGWRPGSRPPRGLAAQNAGEELARIRLAHGALTAEAIVAEARAENAPLHEAFEWRDGLAAAAWRGHQARELVRAVVLVRVEERPIDPPVRALVSVTRGEARPEYVPVEEAFRDEFLRRQVLKRARRELEAWRARYENLEELARVIDAIDGLDAA